jgi:hypothetical protein
MVPGMMDRVMAIVGSVPADHTATEHQAHGKQSGLQQGLNVQHSFFTSMTVRIAKKILTKSCVFNK